MKISAELLPTLSRLLDEALDLSPEERERWLAQLPESDRALAPTLRELLARRDLAESRDVLDTLPKFAPAEDRGGAEAPGRFAAGDIVGPYRLLSELGRGGMGEVWLAERSDRAPARRVALKLPHAHLAAALQQRFARERDILAELSHPHIAQLYDAGISDGGHPYLAMEWIDGVPITQFCRAARLPLAGRLALFVQVLDAVNYAHARFIAHRDLKPANILVTRAGQVKLLDFGIAKLLSTDVAGAATELTEFGGRAATPDYAAPEQIAGQPVTTAVDLYAVGVVLFELLTGARPFTSQQRAQSESRDPPLASQRVTEAEAAVIGGLKAAALRHALQGDLDAIIAKALEHDPSQRYRAAEALADDLHRYQRHEPISARRISRLMLARKFVRRHRIAVGLTTALLLALIAGAAGTTVEAVKASAAAQRAEQEALRAKSEAQREKGIKDFLISVFSASDPRIASDKPRGTVTAAELLDASAVRIEKEFAADPDTQIELMSVVTEIFDAYHDYDRYQALHSRYVKLMTARYGESDARVVTGLMDEADHALLRGDQDTASRLLDQTDVLIHKAGLDHARERALWWESRANLLRARAVTGPERVQALENAIALYAEVAPADEVYAVALSSLGGIRHRTGDDAAAIALYQRAINVLVTRFGAGFGELSPLYINLAQAQTGAGEFDAALRSLEQAVALTLKTYGPTHSHYVDATAIYARLLHRRGQRRAGLEKLETLMASLPGEADKYSDVYAAQAAGLVRESYGECLLAEGRAAQAIPYLEAATRIYSVLPMYSDQKQSFPIHLDLGEAYSAVGRLDDARRELDAVVNGVAAVRKPDDALLLRARESLGRLLQQQGMAKAADEQLRQVLAAAGDHSTAPVARAYADLALLAAARNDQQEADTLSAKAVDIGASLKAEPEVRLNPWLWNARARVLLRFGQAAEARNLEQRALDAERRYDDPSSPDIGASQRTLSAANAALSSEHH